MSEPRQIPVIVLGVGNVGSALLQQLMQTWTALADRYGVAFWPVALANRRAALVDPAGLMDRLPALTASADAGQALVDMPGALTGLAALDVIERCAEQGVRRAIVVDCTAAEGMETPLARALDLEYGLVLANKRPLAGPWDRARVFFNHPLVRFEATVSAGLPVISTLRYLVDTGDRVDRIEGALSGTLSYVCSRLEDGNAFSIVVREAKAKGYTEPDPREDLSGIDVARKVLILGRQAGWPIEMAHLRVDPLYPAEMAEMDVEQFMAELPKVDFDFAAYVGALTGAPRYMAEVGPDGGVVGLRMVGERLAAQLRGTQNQVSFWTRRYDSSPLSIFGPGAGVRAAAAAVLQDCLYLAQSRLCV